jgi:hypothetical protein
MVELASDPALVARLGAAGRHFAEGLTWEAAAHETEAHLEKIITDPARRRAGGPT